MLDKRINKGWDMLLDEYGVVSYTKEGYTVKRMAIKEDGLYVAFFGNKRLNGARCSARECKQICLDHSSKRSETWIY